LVIESLFDLLSQIVRQRPHDSSRVASLCRTGGAGRRLNGRAWSALSSAVRHETPTKGHADVSELVVGVGQHDVPAPNPTADRWKMLGITVLVRIGTLAVPIGASDAIAESRSTERRSICS